MEVLTLIFSATERKRIVVSGYEVHVPAAYVADVKDILGDI